MHQRNPAERLLETSLFHSRWLLAPFYLGLVLALLMLLSAFLGELWHELPGVLRATPEEVILVALSLIDLSLAGNLVVIVIFSGYENFVSKIDTENSEDRPSWMGTLDFSGLKMKLIGSIVAISAISLLRAFMTLTETNVPFDAGPLAGDPAPDLRGVRPVVRGDGLGGGPGTQPSRLKRFFRKPDRHFPSARVWPKMPPF